MIFQVDGDYFFVYLHFTTRSLPGRGFLLTSRRFFISYYLI